jgi:hypothetical protein
MKRALSVSLLVLLPAAALAQAGGGSERPPEPGRYNTPESAPPGWTVVFPDFKLRYLGSHGLGPESDIPIAIYDYEIEGRAGKKKITYATLGDLAPHPFCYEDRAYSLEHLYSDKFGHLSTYEFVIWQEPKGTPCRKGSQ